MIRSFFLRNNSSDINPTSIRSCGCFIFYFVNFSQSLFEYRRLILVVATISCNSFASFFFCNLLALYFWCNLCFRSMRWKEKLLEFGDVRIVGRWRPVVLTPWSKYCSFSFSFFSSSSFLGQKYVDPLKRRSFGEINP